MNYEEYLKNHLLQSSYQAMKAGFNSLSDEMKHSEFCKLLDEKNDLLNQKVNLIKYLEKQIQETGINESNMTIEGDYESLEEFKSKIVMCTCYGTLIEVLKIVKSGKYEC